MDDAISSLSCMCADVPRSTGGSGMDASHAASLLKILLQLGDAQLLHSFITAGPMTNSRVDIGAMAGSLLDCCTQLGWQRMGPVMVQLVQRRLATDGRSSSSEQQRQVLALLCRAVGMPAALAPGAAEPQKEATVKLRAPAGKQSACLLMAQALVNAAMSSHGVCSGSTCVQLMACVAVMAGTEELQEQCVSHMIGG